MYGAGLRVHKFVMKLPPGHSLPDLLSFWRLPGRSRLDLLSFWRSGGPEYGAKDEGFMYVL